MWTKIAGFFGGINLVTYVAVGLGTVVLVLMGANHFANKRLDEAREELGIAKATIFQMVEANQANIESIDVLQSELVACAGTRESAMADANEARRELVAEQKEAYLNSDERTDEIRRIVEEAISSTTCGSVPPRAAELLIDAARSANASADSP